MENLSITASCGPIGGQDYPMLSFLETGFQVTKKGTFFSYSFLVVTEEVGEGRGKVGAWRNKMGRYT